MCMYKTMHENKKHDMQQQAITTELQARDLGKANIGLGGVKLHVVC